MLLQCLCKALAQPAAGAPQQAPSVLTPCAGRICTGTLPVAAEDQPTAVFPFLWVLYLVTRSEQG
jgi:hypothetical protein